MVADFIAQMGTGGIIGLIFIIGVIYLVFKNGGNNKGGGNSGSSGGSSTPPSTPSE